jgi:hypothetical protein
LEPSRNLAVIGPILIQQVEEDGSVVWYDATRTVCVFARSQRSGCLMAKRDDGLQLALIPDFEIGGGKVTNWPSGGIQRRYT